MTIKKVLLVLMLSSTWMAHAQSILVTPVTTPTENNGQFYSLPKSILSLEIPVKRTTKTPGSLSKYYRLINVDPADLITAASTEYAVDFSNIGISGSEIPDEKSYFKVEMKKRFFKKNSVSLEFNENGLLTGAEISSEDNTIPIVTTLLSSAAKVAGTYLGTAKAGAAFKTGLKEAEDDFVSSKSTDAELRKAIEFAKNISDLQARKHELLGCCSFSGDVTLFQKMLDALDAELNALTATFVGTVETKTIIEKFRIDPTLVANTTSIKIDLFKISKADGLQNVFVDPYNAWNSSFDGKGVLTAPVVISIEVSNPSTLSTIFATPSTATDKGFYYRMPATGVVNVRADNVVKVARPQLISQFGPIVSLPAKVNNSKVEFYLNGAIHKLSLTGQPVKAEEIEKTGDAITGAYANLKKKEPEKVDELAVLERQRKILEEKVKIDELIKKLANQ